jgi:uncharacterized membrane protein (TIGR02234 family)
MADAAARRRRAFAPTVLVGLGAATLTAVAAGQDWATASGSAGGAEVTARASGSQSAPLALSLALVALAAWGVVLVVRGHARRLVAVLGALAAAGVLATAVTQAGRSRGDAVARLVSRGGTADQAATALTGWYFVCAVAALVSLSALALAVVVSPRWPGMGSRYDAPTTRARAGAVGEPRNGGADPGADTVLPAPTTSRTEQDMWHALDDGRDPTA